MQRPSFLIAACWLLALSAAAADHQFSLRITPGAEQRLPLAREELAEAGLLRLSYERDEAPSEHGQGAPYLDVCLVAADGRYFALADPVALDERSAKVRLPLEPSRWSGSDGELGADALGAMSYLLLRAHAGKDGGKLTGTIGIDAASSAAPSFAVELPDAGLIDRGPWRELRLRLIGHRDGERGELDLVDGQKRLPLFLDQALSVADGEWHVRGAPRWTLRLRAGEEPHGHLEWRLGSRSWKSDDLPKLALVGKEPLPEAPRQALPPPTSEAWSGRPVTLGSLQGEGGHWLQPRVDLPACLAPILSWNDRWSGFRGPSRVAWPEAAACDLLFAKGLPELDLLPQSLLEEKGAFRFGLSPWAAAQGGPWKSPCDAFAADGPWVDWRAHARNVVARARAAPGLERWRIGLRALAVSDADATRMRALIDDLAGMVARCDGRPLQILDPQAIDYLYDDKAVSGGSDTCWYGFEDGIEDWKSGPLPIVGKLDRDENMASDGKACLRIPLATTAGPGGQTVGGAFIAPDKNFSNLDLLRFDAAAAGDGAVQLYAWVTDDHHRWFQQRLDWLPTDKRWRAVAVPFDDEAPWEAIGSDAKWGPDARRRIRRFGIVGFYHPKSGGGNAVLRIDRVRRLGWPREAEPQLAVTELKRGASQIALYAPLTADFSLSIAARNPYDPDTADVVGEVEGPGGIKRSYPAYWAEPMRLGWSDARETVTPAGAGSWHWRFMPTAEGTWRWRLRARVKWRDVVKEATTEWTEATVGGPAADAMPPVRVSQRDPAWFETMDGAFFYPVGLNLRSPGDDRQNQVLSQLPHHSAGDPNDIERPLSVSSEWERMGTRAYERWLPRMRANGFNWARVWMCPWWCGLEWTRAWDEYGGLTWYSQAAAARLDRVMELAQQNRIYIQIELMNHGQAGESADRQWQDSPYNAANGGPCRRAYDYFADDKVFDTEAKRLRYTMARWGWRSQVAAWVLSSELEWTAGWYTEARGNEDTGRSLAMEKWVRKQLDWFQANDPLPRAVSVHFSHPWDGASLWTMDGLGFNNSNAYTGFQDFGRLGGNRSGGRDLPLGLDVYLNQHFPPKRLHRPTLIGEWGGHWSDNDSATLAQELHVGLWVQATTPYAGNTGFWWWLWLDAADKWAEYAHAAAFVAGDDRRGLGYQQAKPSVNGSAGVLVEGMASENEHRYYAWLSHLDQQARGSAKEAGEARIETGAPNSAWRVERWSCEEGKVEKTFDLRADPQGTLALPLERINPDAAFKLSRVQQPSP